MRVLLIRDAGLATTFKLCQIALRSERSMVLFICICTTVAFICVTAWMYKETTILLMPPDSSRSTPSGESFLHKSQAVYGLRAKLEHGGHNSRSAELAFNT